jgi:DNA-binding transcriptional MerR regulator
MPNAADRPDPTDLLQPPLPPGPERGEPLVTAPRYRSAAVARMLRMPVATLRIWQQRHRVVAPALSAGGHRLYSAADVQRLALLRQLTEQGHAIGAIAALDVEQLRSVARTHASLLARPRLAGERRAGEPVDVAGAGSGASGAGSVTGDEAGAASAAYLAMRPSRRRRYDDATLAEIAGLSSTIACECPKHVADLLIQLTQFEAYSAQCVHRSPADAALHAHLQLITGRARALLEGALERVVLHEGLVLRNG